MRTICAHNDLHCLQCLSDSQSEATSSPVLWFRSLVSCPAAIVEELLGYWYFSVVIEKLKSPGKFSLPFIMVVHKGPSPVLLFDHFVLIVTLFRLVHAGVLVKQ